MPPRGRLYGREAFAPGKICSQIALLQLLHTGTLSLLTFAGCALVGAPWSLAVILSTHYCSVTTRLGWIVISASILTALATAWYVSIIVGRLKKSVDFCFTNTFLFVVAVWARNAAFPASATWWVVTVLSFIVTAVLAEFLCVRREMLDISVSDIPAARPAAPASGSSSVRLRRGDSAGSSGIASSSSSPNQGALGSSTPQQQLRAWQGGSRRSTAAASDTGGLVMPAFFISSAGGGGGLDSLHSVSTDDGGGAGFFVQQQQQLAGTPASSAGGGAQRGQPPHSHHQSRQQASGSTSDPMFFPFMSPAVLGRGGGTITRRAGAAAAAGQQVVNSSGAGGGAQGTGLGSGAALLGVTGGVAPGGGGGSLGAADQSGGSQGSLSSVDVSGRGAASSCSEGAGAHAPLHASDATAEGGGGRPATVLDLGATPTGKTSKGGAAPRPTASLPSLLAWGTQFFR